MTTGELLSELRRLGRVELAGDRFKLYPFGRVESAEARCIIALARERKPEILAELFRAEAALKLVKRAEVTTWTLDGVRSVQISRKADSPELREALSILGYGSLPVMLTGSLGVAA